LETSECNLAHVLSSDRMNYSTGESELDML